MNSPVRTIAAAACLTFALAACSTGTGTSSSADPATSAKADAALATLSSSVLSKGPHGETAANADSITLTPAELAQVKAKNATAAIVLHYGGNDWSQAQVEGLKSEFAQLGITVQAVTDANFKPDKQVSDLETVMSRKPNVIVSIPTDPVATAAEYKKVADAGTKLVFMDNVPQGLVAGKDYTSVVSADNYANGVASAHLMAKSLGGKGKIGVIFHQADFFVTKQRYDGFTSTLKSDYPGIQIV
ncbi:MAG: ribose transport system substrate-binding protein, partial [Pseudonocardiales bacterium]|nr:ribose transport system substrate-binding protein [Pseudonocardiales bacterium]